jgi:hypothetical protein
METRTPILPLSAAVFEGNGVVRNGEDGPYTLILQHVGVNLPDGSEYIHGEVFERRDRAERLAARINEAGSVDLAYWFKSEVTSFAELMEIEYQAELEDRRAWGASPSL